MTDSIPTETYLAGNCASCDTRTDSREGTIKDGKIYCPRCLTRPLSSNEECTGRHGSQVECGIVGRLRAEVARLRQALDDFGQHQQKSCLDLPASETKFCYCGLNFALNGEQSAVETPALHIDQTAGGIRTEGFERTGPLACPDCGVTPQEFVRQGCPRNPHCMRSVTVSTAGKTAPPQFPPTARLPSLTLPIVGVINVDNPRDLRHKELVPEHAQKTTGDLRYDQDYTVAELAALCRTKDRHIARIEAQRAQVKVKAPNCARHGQIVETGCPTCEAALSRLAPPRTSEP